MHVLKHPHVPTRVNSHAESKDEETRVLSHRTEQNMRFQSAKRLTKEMEGWLPSLKRVFGRAERWWEARRVAVVRAEV